MRTSSVCVVAVVAMGACSSSSPSTTCSSTDAQGFVKGHQTAYRASIARATRWLEQLVVDPIDLQRRGEKGKKHFVEALDAWGRLYAVAPPEQRPALMANIQRIAAWADDDRYHDMGDVDDVTFKQGSTSYLRAALLLEELGFDTTRYREEIKTIAPRLDRHLKKRGVHQRLVFAWYYAYFDLDEPFPLATAYEKGMIARRVAPTKMSRLDVYALTHEIFSPYEYGERLDVDPFNAEEKGYLYDALPQLLQSAIEGGNVDLAAELVSCMRYLRFTAHPLYVTGLEFLLRKQHQNGTWGTYPRQRKALGDVVDQAYVLHTTAVAVDALTVAFHPPWNTSVTPWCSSEQLDTYSAARGADDVVDVDDETETAD